MSVTAEINLAALKHNYDVIAAQASESACIAMVKANAYGHGLVTVAKVLQQADMLGVARIEEAIELRDQGIKQAILVTQGVRNSDQLDAAFAYELDIAVHTIEQIELLEHKQNAACTLQIWLKLDTGMHRLGVLPTLFQEAWSRLKQCPSSRGSPYLMTHFSSADDLQSDFTAKQIGEFENLTSGLDTRCSLANSAAIFAYPHSHRDFVRPGIALYGVSPFANRTAEALGLQAVMTLKAPIIAIKQLKKGDYVGYGATWQCPRDATIAIVSAGYGDGYPYSVKNGTEVLINGERAPLVGRVSMDLLTVDITDVEQVSLGDDVILWGEELPVEEIARQSQTIAYELLAKVTQRVVLKELH